VLRAGISPHDEFFIVLIALNHLLLLIEDAPRDWQMLFIDFQEELTQWSSLHMETLDSLVRKAENERMLAEVSSRLVSSLIDLTTFSKELMTRLDKLPPPSSESKLISQIQEHSDQLRNITHILHQITDRLNRMNHHAMSQKSTVKATVPAWLLFLLAAFTFCSVSNYGLLNSIYQRLAEGGVG
jgi:hypothetical protein